MHYDDRWEEVLKLAEKCGFIVQSYGGVAVLATHQEQIEQYGEEKYKHLQEERFGVNGLGSDNETSISKSR